MKYAGWTARVICFGLLSLCGAVAVNAEPVDTIPGAGEWRLTTGPEFPGAKGTISAADATGGEPHGQIYTIKADFTAGGAYVGMLRTMDPPVAIGRWRLRIKTPARTIAVRVTDSADQTHQRYVSVDASDHWAELVLSEFGTEKEGSHWGGPNDGVFRAPVKTIGIVIQKDSGAPAVSETRIGGISVEAKVVLGSMSPEAYFVTPGQNVALRWPASSAPLAKELSFNIRSYDGKVESSGEAMFDAATSSALIQASFSRGYYEIEFPVLQQTFGVLAQPEVETPDRFFAMDAALSILEQRQAVRDGLIRALRRSGIATARERLYWSRVHPEKDQWNWAVWDDNLLRERYRQTGVSVLEAWHDAPRWAGAIPDDGKTPNWNPYPQDFHAVASLWGPVAKQWASGWAGVEVWNEPEAGFGGYIPGDQLSALTKVVSYSFARNGIRAPIVGGVLAGSFPDSDLLSIYFDNGILQDCDVFSFHNYGPPVMVEKQVAGLRGLMKGHANASLPFWITESGRAWKKGPPRASLQDDRFSALEVTMKGVESKACGVAKYFPFVYCYYGEGEINWGMMGQEASPLRSMAAYANSASQLAGMQYVGDWAGAPKPVVRARVFADQQGDAAVIVLYTGKTQDVEIPELPFEAVSLAGIDGRPIEARNGVVVISDGILYARCSLAAVKGALQTNTTAMTLLKMAQGHVPQERAAKPVVLQPDPMVLPHTNKGYLANDPSAVELVLRVHNLSDEALQVSPALKLPAGGRLLQSAGRDLTVDAGSVTTLRYLLDLREAFKQNPTARVVVTDERDLATAISVSYLSTSKPIPSKVPLWHTQTDEMPGLTAEALAGGGWTNFGTKENWIGWGDPADGQPPVKGHLRLFWNEQTLRVEVLVEDGLFHQPFAGPEMWNGDSIQLAFQNRPDGKVADKFTEIIAGLTTGGPQLWRGHAEGGAAGGLLEKSTLKVIREGNYCLYLITLQADEVDLTLAPGRQLGLSLIVNENDSSGRLGWLEWGGGIGSSKRPSEYRSLVLAVP